MDKRRRNLDFEDGDLILDKFSPIEGAIRLGKSGKSAPRYFGSLLYSNLDKCLIYRVEWSVWITGFIMFPYL